MTTAVPNSRAKDVVSAFPKNTFATSSRYTGRKSSCRTTVRFNSSALLYSPSIRMVLRMPSIKISPPGMVWFSAFTAFSISPRVTLTAWALIGSTSILISCKGSPRISTSLISGSSSSCFSSSSETSFKTAAFSDLRFIFKMGILDGSSSKIFGSTESFGKSLFVLALSTASLTLLSASSTGILKSNFTLTVVYP